MWSDPWTLRPGIIATSEMRARALHKGSSCSCWLTIFLWWVNSWWNDVFVGKQCSNWMALFGWEKKRSDFSLLVPKKLLLLIQIRGKYWYEYNTTMHYVFSIKVLSMHINEKRPQMHWCHGKVWENWKRNLMRWMISVNGNQMMVCHCWTIPNP